MVTRLSVKQDRTSNPIVACTLLRAVSPIQLCSYVYTSKPPMVRSPLR
jgi:hypothetical protein